MSQPHLLDQPIWSALTSHQKTYDLGGNPAIKRFAASISAFVALRDHMPQSVAAALDLMEDGDEISMLQVAAPAAPEGIAATEATCIQMLCPALAAGGRREFNFDVLADRDAPDMLDLATLTRPGPFRLHTHRLGRFIGLRIDVQLIAMAGERLHLPGFHEISAVCTHPDHQGQGYGEAMIRALAGRILQEGDTPFLHSYPTNVSAVGLYRKLGFRTRAEVSYAIWKRG